MCGDLKDVFRPTPLGRDEKIFAVIGDMEQEAALIRDAMDLVRKLGTMVLPSIVATLLVLT